MTRQRAPLFHVLVVTPRGSESWSRVYAADKEAAERTVRSFSWFLKGSTVKVYTRRVITPAHKARRDAAMAARARCACGSTYQVKAGRCLGCRAIADGTALSPPGCGL